MKKARIPSFNMIAALYVKAAELSPSERNILASLDVEGWSKETASLSVHPLVSLAEWGYVVVGKTVKLTAKGRELVKHCLSREVERQREAFNTYADLHFISEFISEKELETLF